VPLTTELELKGKKDYAKPPNDKDGVILEEELKEAMKKKEMMKKDRKMHFQLSN